MCRVIVQIIVDEAVWVGKIERVVHWSWDRGESQSQPQAGLEINTSPDRDKGNPNAAWTEVWRILYFLHIFPAYSNRRIAWAFESCTFSYVAKIHVAVENYIHGG